MSSTIFYPEMGGKPAEGALEARMGYNGKVYIKTPRVLKGRGITLIEVLDRAHLVPQAKHKHGWNSYRLTLRAYEALCQREKVSMEVLL
jgi:hypothetical protein